VGPQPGTSSDLTNLLAGNSTPYSALSISPVTLIDQPLSAATTQVNLATALSPYLVRTLPFYEQPGRDVGMVLGNASPAPPTTEQTNPYAIPGQGNRPVPNQAPRITPRPQLPIPNLDLLITPATTNDEGGSTATELPAAVDFNVTEPPAPKPAEGVSAYSFTRALDVSFTNGGSRTDLPKPVPQDLGLQDLGLAAHQPALLLASAAFLTAGWQDRQEDRRDRRRR
jgi:hypothetical protein